MKIEKGKRYLCLEDVVMEDSDTVAYYKDKIYRSEVDDCITNEQGDKEHWWPKDNCEPKRETVFQEYIEFVWGEEVEYRNGGRWETGTFVGRIPKTDSFYPCVLLVDDHITCKEEIRKKKVKLTKQEIANKFGISPNDFEII